MENIEGYSIHRHTLDIHSVRSQAMITVRQFDTLVKLYFTLSDGGKPYLLPENSEVRLFAKKKTGNFAEDCIVNNSVIEYTFSDQPASSVGDVSCELRVYVDGKVLASPSFTLRVMARVIADNDVADPENVIPSILDRIMTSEADAEDAAENAAIAKRDAESAAVEADQARIDAHTFSVSASTSATNAISAAESAAKSADRAANYSKNAKEYTDQRITDLVGGAPAALDTLKEISDALENNDSAVDAIISSLAEKEYTFNYYDENYSKKDNEHFKHNIDTFMRAAVVEQKKKGSPFRPKVFLTDDGVNLPKHENGKDILGSIPWRQGTFNGNHQFDGHIFVRPDIREGGWSANDLPYVGMIATSKKYVDGINRQKRCIAPYSKCLHLDKRYIKSVDGEKGEGESLVFAYREVPQNVTRVCAEVTLEFDYNVPGAGVAIAIAVRNETSSKAVKYLAWFTLLENKVELKYNHLKDAVFDKVTKFDAGIGAFYNVDHDKAFTLSLEYTDEYIACYVNGTCIKKVTDHDRSYAGGMRPTLLIGPSEEMSGTVHVHSAGFGVNYSAMSYADFDELQLGHLPEWSASAPIYGIEQGTGVDKWNVVETGYDGTMSVNSGYVNGKIKSIVSEALSNIGVAEGRSY